ncbi:finTRIM family, member 67, partial [Silurus asotus]
LVFVCEMAHAGVFLEHDQFNCSICLDVLKDPVTVPCGHSYCKACIKGYWDQDDYLGVYGCPQCRQSFTPRPVLGRNTMLADVVEKLKQTAIRAASPPKTEPSEAETSEAEPGEVPCDVCTGNRSLAVRSCLVCLASYCEDHLKPHYESAAFQKHRLTAPTSSLQDSLCPRHDKLLEVFCKTEQRCICYLCLTDEHKGHDTVLASTEISEKKDALAETQRKFQQRIEEREKDLEELRRATQSLTRSAKAALEESERVFTELVCSIERRRTEVKELIRAQERAATSQAEQLLRQLEQEISELKKRDTELSQLAQIENQISFLQNYGSVCVQPVCMDVPCITVDPDFGCVMSAVSEFQALIDDVCQARLHTLRDRRTRRTSHVASRRGEDRKTGGGGILIGILLRGHFLFSTDGFPGASKAVRRGLEEIETKEQGEREGAPEYHEIPQDSEKICTKLLRSIERKHGEVKELLRAEERGALAQAEGLLESLDQQAEDTRRKEAELELLSGTDDHIHFLLVNLVLSLTVCCEVTLDPNTANSFLCLSEGNRKVSTCFDSQHYPDHKERFSSWAQVLAREAISTRRYWEVEWSGSGGIGIGVSYKGINRHSGSADGKLGCNSKSWSLNLCNGHCTFQHNKTKLEIPSPISARIGVYVDHKAGILAFYCISPRRDTMNLLHRIFTTFSHPLYPGFWLGPGSTLKL